MLYRKTNKQTKTSINLSAKSCTRHRTTSVSGGHYSDGKRIHKEGPGHSSGLQVEHKQVV